MEDLKDSYDKVARPSFTNLPTTTVIMDLKGHVMDIPRIQAEKSGEPYVLATVHYRNGPEGRELILDSSKIKELLMMVPQPDGYPHSVGAMWHYGEKRI